MISSVQCLQTWVLAACLLAASVAAAQPSVNPEFQEQALSAGHFQVGVLGSAQIQLVTELEGVTFKARGLPKGLSCDAQTGIISGYPAKAGEAKVVLTAKLGKVSASRKVELAVAPLPDLGGTEFISLVGPNELAWARWGGLISLKLTASGALSGKLRVDKRAYPLKGLLQSEGEGLYLASLPVTAGVTLSLRLQAEVPVLYCFLEDTEVATGAEFYPVLTKQGDKISKVKGTYNIYLSVPQHDDEDLPQGVGFLVAKIAAGGRVNIKGKLPDGSVLTASSPLMASTEIAHLVMMHVPLYERRLEGSRAKTSTGVFQAALDVLPASETSFDEKGIYSNNHYLPLWLKAAQHGEGDGLHEDGFEMGLEATGFIYRRPVAGQLLLGAERGSFNARVIVYIDEAIPYLWQHSVTLTPGHKVIPDSVLAGTARKLNFKMNASTGLFSGSYVMDGDGAGSQKAAFAGIISTPRGASQARGYLLLEDPAGAVTGEARAMQSYRMVIEPQTPIDVSAGPGSPPGGGAPSSGGAGLGAPGPGGPTNPENPTTGPFPFPEPMPVQPVWGDQGNQGNPGTSSGGTLPTLPSSGSLTIASGSSVSFGGSVNYGGSFNNGVSLIHEGSLSFGSGSSTQLSGVPISWISWDGSTIYDPLPPP